MPAAKVQASLRIRAVSPEPPLLAHTSSESRGTFRQKARSLAPLNGWACAVKICHDGMLEDTNSLDASQLIWLYCYRHCPESLRSESCISIACPLRRDFGVGMGMHWMMSMYWVWFNFRVPCWIVQLVVSGFLACNQAFLWPPHQLSWLPSDHLILA